MAAAGSDKAFEIFIKRAVLEIQKESWGRNRESKELRDACNAFLTLLERHESSDDSSVRTELLSAHGGSVAIAVLAPLRLACLSGVTKVQDLALGCLHKLVAHAWLQGESSITGFDEEHDVVSQVIRTVIKCTETPNEPLQLSVIRGLLTFTTAEHFIAHGDCLLAAVSAVFNLALGSDNENIKRTACNALLQILNTVSKRVTAYQLHDHYSERSISRRVSSSTSPSMSRQESITPIAPSERSAAQVLLAYGQSDGAASAAAAAIEAAAGHALAAESSGNGTSTVDTVFSAADVMAADARMQQLSMLAAQHDIHGLEAVIGASGSGGNGGHNDSDGGSFNEQTSPPTASALPNATASSLAFSNQQRPSHDGSVGAPAHDLHNGHTLRPSSTSNGAGAEATLALREASAASVLSAAGPSYSLSHPSASVRNGSMSTSQLPLALASLRNTHRGALTLAERDVLLVLAAFCKLASREAGVTEVESYLHHGKLLALELLVKVLQNPQHVWEHVRDEFCRHLRQPLCITMLRNCAASDPAAFQLGIKLLMAVLLQPRLRRGLRAELGAFYPLLVLQPLEEGVNGTTAATSATTSSASALAGAHATSVVSAADLATVAVAVGALKQMCGDAQLVVDLFVNYDCDLNAPNLYERTLAALCRLSQKMELDAGTGPGAAALAKSQAAQAEAAARLAAVRDLSLRCVLSLVACMEAWATPLKEASARAALPFDASAPTGVDAAAGSAAALDVSDPLLSGPSLSAFSVPSFTSAETSAGSGAGAGSSEAERVEAIKSHKSALSRGIALFNHSPIKGIKFLINAGLVEATPQGVAVFIRGHSSELDKAMIGEYFGHHEEFEVAAMHAYIDMERYVGMQIDSALRRLLEQFRLPGEAQKIDRIMEKFSERYCHDNPTKFRNADGAYMLSFAIIMLNTDAHNVNADKRLNKATFVEMNQQPGGEDGEMQPVLPAADLEGIYDRIVANEIAVRDDSAARASRAQTSLQAQQATRNRLAAAVGLRVTLPFRSLGVAWDSKKAAALSDSERKRMIVDMAERAVAKGAGAVWQACTHAEVCRPLMAVSGAPIKDALAAALRYARDARSVEALTRGMTTQIELSSVLGLDELCESCTHVLALASGVHAPAPCGSFEEQKQLVVLRALVQLPLGPQGRLLGSSWPIVLRAISALDALMIDLTRPPSSTATAKPSTGTAFNALQPINKMFSALSWYTQPAPAPSSEPHNGEAGPQKPRGGVGLVARATAGAGAQPPPIRTAPGAALVMWAAIDGLAAIEQVYASSTSLDGEALVVLVRALAAVSREELERPVPRVYSLHKLVEVGHLNIARIRLVWARLWAVLSGHLVMTSCHTVQVVGLHAVNSLRQLMFRLLARAELQHFTTQEEALRPFVGVLRLCDNTAVRSAAVASVAAAAEAHASDLGSGWRMLIEVLRRAANDSYSGIVQQALQALQTVISALYRSTGGGHECLHDCLRALQAAIANSHHTEHSVSAVHLLVSCGGRLSDHRHQLHQQALNNGAAAAAARAAPPRRPLTGAATFPLEERSAASEATSSGRDKSVDGAGTADKNPQLLGSLGDVDAPHSKSLEQAAADAGWVLILGILADLIADEPRPPVVDAAVEAVFQLLRKHGGDWSDAALRILVGRVLTRLFEPAPGAQPLEDEAAAATYLPRLQQRFPEVMLVTGRTAGGGRDLLGPHLLQGSQVVAVALAAGLTACGGTGVVCAQLGQVPTHMRRELQHQLARAALMWFRHCFEPVASAGLAAFRALADALMAVADAEALLEVFGLVEAAAAEEMQQVVEGLQQERRQPLSGAPAAAAAAAQLRTRCRMLLMLQRTLGALLQRLTNGNAPWPLQSSLLSTLSTLAKEAARFNAELAVEVAALQGLPQTLPAGHSTPTGREAAATTSTKLIGDSAAEAGNVAGPLVRSAVSSNSANSLQLADNILGSPSFTRSAAVTADASVSLGKVAAAEAAATTAAATASQGGVFQPSGKPPLHPSSVRGGSKVVDGEEGTAGNSPVPPPLPRLDASSVPLIVSSAVSSEHLVPALARLEVEGGLALIAILQQQHKQATGAAAAERQGSDAGMSGKDDMSSDGTSAAEVPAFAEQLLTELCMFIVATNAPAFLSAPAGAGGRSWDLSVRSPLLTHAIGALIQLPNVRDAKQLLRLFPHMVALVTCQQPHVRHAVAQYMAAIVGPTLLSR